MFSQYKNNTTEEIAVCGIPFSVSRDEKGLVKAIEGGNWTNVKMANKCEVLFFLGMANTEWCCSEWWGQNEVMFNHDQRVFIGDKMQRICVVYEDNTQDTADIRFGVNCWNYDLFCEPGKKENRCFRAPYDEPFRSDANARKLLEDSLHLMQNDAEDYEKNTKWVFAFRVNPNKTIKFITWGGKKNKGVNISAVTGLNAGEEIDPKWPIMTNADFLNKSWFKAADKLAHRLYTYMEDIPNSVTIDEIEGFDAPDIRFYGSGTADIYTNVYRYNLMDMAYEKVTADGMPHTSSEHTYDFGCYGGMGTYTAAEDYFPHVWIRDNGRSLTEVVNFGYEERPILAADKLFEMLKPSITISIPHWSRIANLPPDEDNPGIDRDRMENDGHGAIMLFMYSLYNKGVVGKEWVKEKAAKLKEAADFIFWQIENPVESGFDKVLFTYSESSDQAYGSFDLFSNATVVAAMEGFARMFADIGDVEYAQKLADASKLLRDGIDQVFMMDHPRYGNVYTDTTTDCWTHEYKRFCEALMEGDIHGYDMATDRPDRYEILSRTFRAQKELSYYPFAGRQMGYGQGYLTVAAITLDMFDELTECMDAIACESYHPYDRLNYIIPEGIVRHGSGKFWFRQSDLGNAVQQAEPIKCARLLVGIDDITVSRGLRLIPRLPNTWTKLEAKNYTVNTADGRKKFDFTYQRATKDDASYDVYAQADGKAYGATFSKSVPVTYLRVGPFDSENITVRGGIVNRVVKLQNRWFAMVTPC
ncbi:MAG: hypothetical protein E7335_09210 [Clostridiales bacterium]|nr:hypothetical protein [Clostridiales bacterium]